MWRWCGVGVALEWPWSGVGVVVVWHWCGFPPKAHSGRLPTAASHSDNMDGGVAVLTSETWQQGRCVYCV